MMNIFAYQWFNTDYFDEPTIDSFDNAVDTAPLGIGSYYFDRRIGISDVLNITNENIAMLRAHKFDIDILMDCSNLLDYNYRKIASDFDQAVSRIDPRSHTVFGINPSSADLLVRHYFETQRNAEKLMTEVPQFVICEHPSQEKGPRTGCMMIMNDDLEGGSA